MKIAFYSNYLNHHQLPLCLALDRLTNHQFTFVANSQIPEFREKLGYQDMNHQYPFVLRAYETAEAQMQATALARECDVAIIGSAPQHYVTVRLQQKKLTFKYSERIFKEGLRSAFRIRTIGSMLFYHTKYLFSPLYMLCASAYTKQDYQLYGAYIGKCLKWGYFPEVKTYDDVDLVFREKEPASILWAGRLIDWKHPESVVYVAKELKKNGIPFQMNIIGDGEMRMKIEQQIGKHNLQDCVTMLGAMTPEQVRRHMEKSQVFIFTSDRHEGWGAVLNEAMNSGCAVVASKTIGSVPFLISNGVNGLLFDESNWQQLATCITELLQNDKKRIDLGYKAYQTIMNEWNPDTAAERFLQIAECILEKKTVPYTTGPCSKA